MISTLWQSTALVAVSEMGDKTQLLAFALAARFKRPWAVMGGILVATLANHSLAAISGSWIAAHFSQSTIAISTAVVFFVFGFWALRPDSLDSDSAHGGSAKDAFRVTLVTFFLAEMGDKTQLATMALGAKTQQALAVTIGTTLGMLISDGLAVALGQRLSRYARSPGMRWLAAGLFFAFGLVALWSAWQIH
jgi:putative Ca2+/H+ antiporter (TMEM165/GDT1 family)